MGQRSNNNPQWPSNSKVVKINTLEKLFQMVLTKELNMIKECSPMSTTKIDLHLYVIMCFSYYKALLNDKKQLFLVKMSFTRKDISVPTRT